MQTDERLSVTMLFVVEIYVRERYLFTEPILVFHTIDNTNFREKIIDKFAVGCVYETHG